MIIKKQYLTNNAIKDTLIDNVDKIDTGEDNNTVFINVYKRDRKKDDDFFTINVLGVNVFIMNDEGKTLQVFRGKR